MATYISLELTTVIRDVHHGEGREPVFTGTFSRVKSQLIMDQDGAHTLHRMLMHNHHMNKRKRKRCRTKIGADFRENLARGDMLDDDLQGLLRQREAPVFYLDDTRSDRIVPAREVTAHDGVVTERSYYTWPGLRQDPHDKKGDHIWDHHYNMPVPAHMQYDRVRQIVTFDYYTKGESAPPANARKVLLTDPIMSECYQASLPYAYHVEYAAGQIKPCAMTILQKDKFSGQKTSRDMQPHEIDLYRFKMAEYHMAQCEKSEQERKPFKDLYALFDGMESARITYIVP